MFSSPITSWENVSAYFTFADSPTGIAISLPAGFEGQIRPRSGLAIKNGIGLLQYFKKW